MFVARDKVADFLIDGPGSSEEMKNHEGVVSRHHEWTDYTELTAKMVLPYLHWYCHNRRVDWDGQPAPPLPRLGVSSLKAKLHLGFSSLPSAIYEDLLKTLLCAKHFETFNDVASGWIPISFFDWLRQAMQNKLRAVRGVTFRPIKPGYVSLRPDC